VKEGDIPHNPAFSRKTPETAAAIVHSHVHPQAGPAARTAPTHKGTHWGGRTFRFSIASFRFRKNLSTQRFSFTEAAFLLMMAYVTSKGLGAIRQALFNALFGTSPEAIAYYAAFRLPDAIFNLIAAGALAQAFIPIFLSYEKDHGQRAVWRLTSLVFNVLLVSLTLLVLVAELLAPRFVNTILVPGLPPAQQALTTTLMRIMLVYPLIMGLVSIATAVLNGKRRFLLPALSLALYDVGLIAGLLTSLIIPGVGIYGPTLGLLASAICQGAVLLPGLRKQGAHYTFLWDLRHPGLHEVMRLLIPNVLAIGISSTAIILDTSFASYLPDRSSIGAMHNAYLLFTFPLIFVSQAIGQALLPQITTQAAHHHYVRMRQTVLRIVGGAVLLSIPAAIVLYILGKPAIRLLFQHGAFTAHASALTTSALLGYTVGLPGLTAEGLLILSFYALKDARTPLLINIAALAMRISLIFLLLKVLIGEYAILALPLAASVTSTTQAVLLCLILLIRLQTKVKTDIGMQRLQQRRENARRARAQTEHLTFIP
jgi:putative peptidoglycan lipid II flippase